MKNESPKTARVRQKHFCASGFNVNYTPDECLQLMGLCGKKCSTTWTVQMCGEGNTEKTGIFRGCCVQGHQGKKILNMVDCELVLQW